MGVLARVRALLVVCLGVRVRVVSRGGSCVDVLVAGVAVVRVTH